MKAIIMAGGEGSRLRPLTCGRPKPMVPVVNRPIMEHIINLLKKHDLYDIGVTLQYMPEAIRDYFGRGSEYGVHLRYFVEDVPLGTAGSVKNAENFLDETFIVISGDALTGIDLTEAIKFHRQKGAMATLVLTRVDTPLEYGVVITAEDGRVRQFLEKPGWGEVFSDTVNTGIYVLEPEVLGFFKAGQKFDFSQDLFPILLEKNLPLYGVTVPGYWCDIGNLEQYLQAHIDILDGQVEVEMPGVEQSPGIWIGDQAEIDPSAKINAPALIGAGTRLGANVTVDSWSVIGENCTIGEQSSIKKSVLWNHALTGPSVSLRGAVVCSRVQVLANADVYEGAVIGSDCQVRARSIIKPNVKLWPQKTIGAGSTVQHSIIWGTRQPKRLFGLEGITGLVNIEITPELAAKLAAAYASTLGMGAGVAVSSDACVASKMLKKAVLSGLQSAGAVAHDLGCGITPMHRFAVRSYKFRGGIHIKRSPRQAGAVNIILTNERGSNLPRGQERKVENIVTREDFNRAESLQLIPGKPVTGVPEKYLKFISSRVNKESIKDAGYKVIIAYDKSTLGSFIKSLCAELNIQQKQFDDQDHVQPQAWVDYQKILPGLSQQVQDQKADLGIILEANADRVILVDEKGEIIQDDLLTALIALIALRLQNSPVIVPVTAPKVIEALAKKYEGQVVRTKTAVQDFLERLILEDEQSGGKAFSQFLMNFDGLFALITLLSFMAENKLSLSQLRDEIPVFFMNKKDVPVAWEAKGRVIRRLISEKSPGVLDLPEKEPVEIELPENELAEIELPASEWPEMELVDGVKVFHPQGWTLVLPDPEEPVCRVFSEGVSMEAAESLSDFYIDKINSIIEDKKLEAGNEEVG